MEFDHWRFAEKNVFTDFKYKRIKRDGKIYCAIAKIDVWVNFVLADYLNPIQSGLFLDLLWPGEGGGGGGYFQNI